MARAPFSVVLRISDVAVSRAELENALGDSIDRYEPSRAGPPYYSKHYAQVDIISRQSGALLESDVWAKIIKYVGTFGPRLRALKNDGRIGRTSIDVAVSFPEDLAVVTYNLPSGVAEAVGRQGLDLDVSVYLG